MVYSGGIEIQSVSGLQVGILLSRPTGREQLTRQWLLGGSTVNYDAFSHLKAKSNFISKQSE